MYKITSFKYSYILDNLPKATHCKINLSRQNLTILTPSFDVEYEYMCTFFLTVKSANYNHNYFFTENFKSLLNRENFLSYIYMKCLLCYKNSC